MIETNPYGANGSTSDPREQACWDFYIESLEKGMPNAYESAIKAGYKEATAKQITVRRWFLERYEELERKDMLSKAEKKLQKTLDYEVEKDNSIDKELLRIQVDVSKHLTSTLGKNKGYSTRNELTGANGKELKIGFDPVFEDRYVSTRTTKENSKESKEV